MKLSVIIACFNAADTITDQLEALAAQSWSKPWEVIVADNGSTDETLELVAQYAGRIPNLRVIDASERRGAAFARNLGARAANADALAFADADDQVAPGWVAAIGEALAQYDFVASRFDAEKLSEPWAVKARGCPQREGLQEYTYPPFLPHAGGCGLGVKRSLHQAVDGFDESMLRLSDTDYCWRIQLAGAELHFVPGALVHIRHRDARKSMFRQAYQWGEYNVLLYKRYRPFGMPRLSRKRGLRIWIQLLRRLPRIRSKKQFERWIWKFSWQLGRLYGSLKHRVFAL